MTGFQRFAVYFTAPGSELAKRGATWLGWDIATGKPVPQPRILEEATQTPRRYGFHGTLKPPFVLADGYSAHDLARETRALARTLTPFEVPALNVSTLGSFLALTTDDTADLRQLASACVTELDQFRAPPSESELARRRARPLSLAQDALLRRWGYPYVGEEFRFHMTLTGRLKEDERQTLMDRAQIHFSGLTGPQPIVAITLCGEKSDGRFQALEVIPLG
ncbi:MAG: DUF1045 domain-containing protein [Pseudomonadota bacterium]